MMMASSSGLMLSATSLGGVIRRLVIISRIISSDSCLKSRFPVQSS